MNELDKSKFEDFKSSLSVFLDFPQVEQNLEEQVKALVREMRLNPSNVANRTDVDVLEYYLQSGSSIEKRLKIVLGLTCSSLERLKRICLLMFPGYSWSNIINSEEFIREICKLLANPDSSAGIIPQYIRDCLRVPSNWKDSLSDTEKLTTIAMRSLQAKYAVDSGIALESMVRKIVEEADFECTKGRVEVVNGKEVDVAIPSLDQPQFLIMSSYQLTTSSAQSSRANEQSSMYFNVQNRNRFLYQEGRPPVYLINVIDGGGWIDRKNDLKKMWINSDYCLSHAQLGNLPDILRAHYIPTN